MCICIVTVLTCFSLFAKGRSRGNFATTEMWTQLILEKNSYFLISFSDEIKQGPLGNLRIL